MGFFDLFKLPTRGNAAVTFEEQTENYSLIGQQFDKFKVVGTTSPTASNEPVGELGNVILNNDMYYHNGTEWRRFTGAGLAAPTSVTFLSFSQPDSNLRFEVGEEVGVAMYGIYSVDLDVIIGELNALRLSEYATDNSIPLEDGHKYRIIALDDNGLEITSTLDNGLDDVFFTVI